jgi:hypothetical protein
MICFNNKNSEILTYNIKFLIICNLKKTHFFGRLPDLPVPSPSERGWGEVLIGN